MKNNNISAPVVADDGGLLLSRQKEPKKDTKGKQKKHSLVMNENKVAWLLLTPILLYFVIFQGFPILFGIAIGFTDWLGIGARPRFVGLRNFILFFTDPFYLKTLWNSFYIGMIVMTVNVTVGFAGATLLNGPVRGKTVIRSIWYAPAVTSAVATTQIFLMFIDPSSGIANRIIEMLGGEAIPWFYTRWGMIFWITLYSCWKGIGGSMILWLAGLQSIDPVYYEAAEISGATPSQRLFHITIPMLKNITVYVLITGFIGVLQIFEPVLFISQGGPFGQTDVIVHRVFRDFYGDFNFGMAGAGSLVITIIIFAFSLFMLKWHASSEE